MFFNYPFSVNNIRASEIFLLSNRSDESSIRVRPCLALYLGFLIGKDLEMCGRENVIFSIYSNVAMTTETIRPFFSTIALVAHSILSYVHSAIAKYLLI